MLGSFGGEGARGRADWSVIVPFGVVVGTDCSFVPEDYCWLLVRVM